MNGTITSGSSYGIVLSGSYTDPVTITAGVTLGGTTAYTGLLGLLGSAWSVSNFGAITGTGAAVRLSEGGLLTNGGLTDPSASVQGGRYGVIMSAGLGNVVNFGTIVGETVVTRSQVYGGVTYTSTSAVPGAGVALRQGGSVLNSGAPSTIQGGSYGVSVGGGIGYVANDGTIGASHQVESYGYMFATGVGVALSSGGSVVNGLDGGHAAITGGSIGVLLAGGTGNVINLGTVQANGAYHSPGFNNYYLIRCNGVAVSLANGGSISNGDEESHSALIQGGRYGIQVAGGRAGISNSGTIRASYTYDKDYTIPGSYYSGSSQSRGTAVSALDGGSVQNSGTISGGYCGINVSGALGTLFNCGSVEGFGSTSSFYTFDLFETENGASETVSSGVGVSLASGGEVVNGSSEAPRASIEGAVYGIAVSGGAGTIINYASVGASGTFTNRVYYYSYETGYEGSVYSGFSRGIAIGLKSGGTVVNGGSHPSSPNSYINGSYSGVVVSNGYGYVNNKGKIIGYTKFGVYLETGGTITNCSCASALISGGSYGVLGGGRLDVVNSGRILGNVGVMFDATTTTGTLVNSGTITGIGGIAVELAGGQDTVVLTPGAVFNGNVDALGQQDLLIIGSGVGVSTLTGLGTKFSGFRSVLEAARAGWTLQGSNSVGAGAIRLQRHSTIANDGSLSGGLRGEGAYEAITNVGMVTRSQGAAVSLAHGGRLDNGSSAFTPRGSPTSYGSASTAVISGATYGVVVDDGPALIVNSGTIAGHTGVVFGPNTTSGTLFNSGTITGLRGTAVELIGGSDTVALTPGAVFNGLVIGASGHDVLSLESSAATGTLSGLGTQFTGFGAIEVARGASWSLRGVAIGASTITLGASASLTATAGLFVSEVAFAGSSSTLALDAPASVSSLLSEFRAGDVIDLTTKVATAISFSSFSHVLSVKAGAATLAALHFANGYAGHSFVFGSDGGGGTRITLT